MKASEYRKMTDQELEQELAELRKKLFDFRSKRVTDLMEKSHQIRQARRDVARILTVIRERQRKGSASRQG